MKKLLLGFLLLFGFTPLAHAIPFHLFQISTDYDANLHFFMGVNAGADHAVESAFLNGSNGLIGPYTVKQLEDDFMPFYTHSGFAVIQVRIVSMDKTADSGVVEVKALRTPPFSHFTIQFKFKYEPTLGTYVVTDTRNGKVLHNLIIHPNRSFGNIVGIESLETQ